jgi:hypothetical protein
MSTHYLCSIDIDAGSETLSVRRLSCDVFASGVSFACVNECNNSLLCPPSSLCALLQGLRDFPSVDYLATSLQAAGKKSGGTAAQARLQGSQQRQGDDDADDDDAAAPRKPRRRGHGAVARAAAPLAAKLAAKQAAKKTTAAERRKAKIDAHRAKRAEKAAKAATRAAVKAAKAASAALTTTSFPTGAGAGATGTDAAVAAEAAEDVCRWCDCSCDINVCSLLCRFSGSASALVTFICVLCTLRTQISRSICNFTLYIDNNNNNNNLTINMQLHIYIDNNNNNNLTINMQLHPLSFGAQRR